MQIDIACNYCQLHDFEVVGEYRDEAISGARADNRPGLQEALSAVKQAKGTLVVYALSRFARSTRDAIDLAAALEKAGCDLVSLSEQIDTTTPMGRFTFTVLAALDQLERERTSERTSELMRAMQDNGRRMTHPNKSPYGWMPNPDDRAMIIEHPEEQLAIEDVKRLYRDGDHCTVASQGGSCCTSGNPYNTTRISFRKIAREMELRGHPCRGKRWCHSTVQNILRRAKLLE